MLCKESYQKSEVRISRMIGWGRGLCLVVYEYFTVCPGSAALFPVCREEVDGDRRVMCETIAQIAKMTPQPTVFLPTWILYDPSLN